MKSVVIIWFLEGRFYLIFCSEQLAEFQSSWWQSFFCAEFFYGCLTPRHVGALNTFSVFIQLSLGDPLKTLSDGTHLPETWGEQNALFWIAGRWTGFPWRASFSCWCLHHWLCITSSCPVPSTSALWLLHSWTCWQGKNIWLTSGTRLPCWPTGLLASIPFGSLSRYRMELMLWIQLLDGSFSTKEMVECCTGIVSLVFHTLQGVLESRWSPCTWKISVMGIYTNILCVALRFLRKSSSTTTIPICFKLMHKK